MFEKSMGILTDVLDRCFGDSIASFMFQDPAGSNRPTVQPFAW